MEPKISLPAKEPSRDGMFLGLMMRTLLSRLQWRMTLVLRWCLFLLVLIGPTTAWALKKNEVVLVLDNSGSMGSPWGFSTGLGTSKTMKPSDPERGAILGALVLEALVRNSQDRLTVIAFTRSEAQEPPMLRDPARIRELVYDTGTFFRAPLRAARSIFDAVPKGDGRVLLFFTDGIPNDTGLSPDELPGLIGLDTDPKLNSYALGLWSGESNDPLDAAFQRQARSYLGRMVRLPDDLEFIAGGRQVVPAFTRAYAKALGSRPEVGQLQSGQSKSIDIGKYVVEVLVATAASNPGADYQAKLVGPKGEVPARTGDNGCVSGCGPIRRHFEAFRSENDPTKSSQWTLSIPSSPGNVEYGFILRYDFSATAKVPPTCNVGENVTIESQILFQGNPFADEDFFRSDGFEAFAIVGSSKIPMQHKGGGVFTGVFVPAADLVDLSLPIRAVFRNTWLNLYADTATHVEGQIELTLRPTPNPIDLGSWDGKRSLTSRCTRIDLSGSTNADRIEVTCKIQAEGQLQGMTGTCLPVAGTEATLPTGMGRPLQWEVCAEAPRCPDNCISDPSKPVLHVVLAGKDPKYAANFVKIPVFYRVSGMTWLACWWPILALVFGSLFTLWFIIGWVRPYNFESSLSVRLAGSEVGLKRTSALVLREQPGGVRGFYRNARVCLNGTGDFLRNQRQSILVIEAGPGGTTTFKKAIGLERKDRRTSKWEPLPAEELSNGLTPGQIYRMGNLYIKAE